MVYLMSTMITDSFLTPNLFMFQLFCSVGTDKLFPWISYIPTLQPNKKSPSNLVILHLNMNMSGGSSWHFQIKDSCICLSVNSIFLCYRLFRIKVQSTSWPRRRKNVVCVLYGHAGVHACERACVVFHFLFSVKTP